MEQCVAAFLFNANHIQLKIANAWLTMPNCSMNEHIINYCALQFENQGFAWSNPSNGNLTTIYSHLRLLSLLIISCICWNVLYTTERIDISCCMRSDPMTMTCGIDFMKYIENTLEYLYIHMYIFKAKVCHAGTPPCIHPSEVDCRSLN